MSTRKLTCNTTACDTTYLIFTVQYIVLINWVTKPGELSLGSIYAYVIVTNAMTYYGHVIQPSENRARCRRAVPSLQDAHNLSFDSDGVPRDNDAIPRNNT